MERDRHHAANNWKKKATSCWGSTISHSTWVTYMFSTKSHACLGNTYLLVTFQLTSPIDSVISVCLSADSVNSVHFISGNSHPWYIFGLNRISLSTVTVVNGYHLKLPLFFVFLFVCFVFLFCCLNLPSVKRHNWGTRHRSVDVGQHEWPFYKD